MEIKKILSLVLIIFITSLIISCSKDDVSQEESIIETTNETLVDKTITMKFSGTNFKHQGEIPIKYTCDDEDTNPGFVIQDVPENTHSLVIIMDDPDAMKPAGKIWVHWLLWNIPPETVEILEGQEPQGVHGLGTSGNLDYQGPCPPDTEHAYIFVLYALDTMLDLPEGSNKEQLLQAMEGHIIEKTELVGRYERNVK